MGVVDGFPNNQAIAILEVLCKAKVGTFVSVRDIRKKMSRDDLQYQIGQLHGDHPGLIEYKKRTEGEFSWPLDKDTYSITPKGRQFIRALRRVRKILEV